MKTDTLSLTIGWLYPELMSTYGDRGNIIVFKKRSEWRGISCTVMPIEYKTNEQDVRSCNLIFGGGAQDRQQGIVIDDLRKYKGPVIKKMIDRGIPGLFVCGSPQLLGHSYMMGDGTVLKGLGIFDMTSKHFGKSRPRCIGNMIGILNAQCQMIHRQERQTVVGFENHGGRTYLGQGVRPFARVVVGNGNNGEDKTEGAVYKNCIATYSHGPFLSKNPHIADWLIAKALEIKYKKRMIYKALDDSLEWQAHEHMLKRLTLR